MDGTLYEVSNPLFQENWTNISDFEKKESHDFLDHNRVTVVILSQK